jgi:hypothetical protein
MNGMSFGRHLVVASSRCSTPALNAASASKFVRACRFTDRATDKVRARDQLKNRERDGNYSFSDAARPCGRADRMTVRRRKFIGASHMNKRRVAMRRRDFIAAAGGAIVAWPGRAAPQTQKRSPRIAVLWHAANAEEEHPYLGELIKGFRELGYGEGRITLEHRFPDEKPELFTSMAAELVSLKPDVLVAVGGAAPYAKRATETIPIVFMYVPDPIGSKLVEGIRRPGSGSGCRCPSCVPASRESCASTSLSWSGKSWSKSGPDPKSVPDERMLCES